MHLFDLFLLLVVLLNYVPLITSQVDNDNDNDNDNVLGFGVEAADSATSSIPNSASALTKVVVSSRVGVLLDEIPTSNRAAFISLLEGKNNAWWKARALQQIDLTGYRLTYRTYYYNRVKFQLVLPPHDQMSIVWDEDAPALETRQSHQLFSRKFTMTTYILSTHESIKKSEPALKNIGGLWSEKFVLPIDPTQIFQRTGFACLDEGQYPPGVADPERVSFLYDDTCDVETDSEFGSLGCTGCHCTAPLPTKSCKAALRDTMGSITVRFNFTRVAYNSGIAAQYRTPSSGVNGADLTPSQDDLDGSRVLYRYFAPGSCENALDEKCIGGFGWRRLLYFDAIDQNVGTVDLDMQTTEFVDEALTHDPPTQEIANGLYEYSSCHQHYHFRHFGNFTFQTSSQVPTTSKRGFCAASVDRWANAEWVPTWSDFSTCETQGITRGWSDTYQQGISCQWIDITNIPTTVPSGVLISKTNPDGLLCEGILQKYPNGSQKYELTSFTTLSGQPVKKQSCNRIPNYDANNQVSSSAIALPAAGDSYVTQPCFETNQHFGPLRNCEFEKVTTPVVRSCIPGQTKTLTCTFPSSSSSSSNNYQVLRVCEASRALNTGMACRHQDALQNVVIQSGASITFTCPIAKSGLPAEFGGTYSLYNAKLWGNNPATVSCS